MTLDQDFEAFHEANPDVYRRLRAMALALKARGRKRAGIAMLFEVLRWEHYMTTQDPSSEWKLNNSYRALYARKLMAEVKELDGFFETRALRAPTADVPESSATEIWPW